MLKSTYRPAAAVADPADTPLPPGWTEHKAPTGHAYYFNATTQQSTYTRPLPPSNEPLQIDYGATEPDQLTRASMQVMDEFHRHNGTAQTVETGRFTGGRSYQDHSRRRGNQGDRPKTRTAIPNCDPWVLVMTKLGRRFVHNTETKQSLWKFPQDVMMAVIEMDRLKWEAKKKAEAEVEEQEHGASVETSGKTTEDAGKQNNSAPSEAIPARGQQDYDSDSYEEVEVTDDEADEQSGEPSKRPRLVSEHEEPPKSGPVEFDEDDIAWQLAQMEGEGGEEDYSDLDRPNLEDEDGDEDEGLPLTDQDNIALFRSLLDYSGISPYSTFERFIEDNHIVEDPRYVSLNTVSARKEAFSEWSKDRIAEVQALKQQQTENSRRNKDPKIQYLEFLQKNATPKLYWPEFKRKFKKAPEMGDRNLQDKEREKLYRDFVAKMKLSEPERRKELVALLKDTARTEKGVFERGMQLENLPETILKDVKFHVLEPRRREELISTFLEML